MCQRRTGPLTAPAEKKNSLSTVGRKLCGVQPFFDFFPATAAMTVPELQPMLPILIV